MKELIIIVYKINFGGYTTQQAEESMRQLIDAYNLRDDLEIKENYIIREIWLPIVDGETDVKVIYPITQSYSFTPEINDLVEEISNKIKEDPTNTLSQHWKRLIRELKLKKISN